ncbi:MAG: hypothetical protein ACM3JI_03990 [Anaerolineae bacterium]
MDLSNFSETEEKADPNLNSIRNEIKRTMIPLLIKVFELKHAAVQAKMPPSRLHRFANDSPEKIREQLKKIEQDLSLLHLWCQSCKQQITKAIKETEESYAGKRHCAPSMESISNPAVGKSFTEAISSKTAHQETPDQSFPKGSTRKTSTWLWTWVKQCLFKRQ